MLGVAMGASVDQSLFPVHAQINFAGMSVDGAVRAHRHGSPVNDRGRVAAAQFWRRNVGVPVMLGALALRIKGFQSAEPLVGVESIIVGCSVLLFMWLLFVRIGPRAESLSSAPRDGNPEAMTIRRSTVEHVFGTLKHWMGSTHFLTRTLGRVSTEMSLQVLAYNLKRVMNLLGIARTMKAMRMAGS
jgi:hypothetical protein